MNIETSTQVMRINIGMIKHCKKRSLAMNDNDIDIELLVMGTGSPTVVWPHTASESDKAERLPTTRSSLCPKEVMTMRFGQFVFMFSMLESGAVSHKNQL